MSIILQDGIIDHRYLIQGLDIDLIDATVVNEFQVGESAVVVRKKSMGHETEDELKSEGLIFIIDFIYLFFFL